MRHGSVGGDDSSSQRMMACMFSSIRLSRLTVSTGGRDETGENTENSSSSSKVFRQSVSQRQALSAAIVRRDGIRHD